LLLLTPASFATFNRWLALVATGRRCNSMSFLQCLDAIPFIRRWSPPAVAGVRVGEVEKVRGSMLGIAAATTLGNLNEA